MFQHFMGEWHIYHCTWRHAEGRFRSALSALKQRGCRHFRIIILKSEETTAHWHGLVRVLWRLVKELADRWCVNFNALFCLTNPLPLLTYGQMVCRISCWLVFSKISADTGVVCRYSVGFIQLLVGTCSVDFSTEVRGHLICRFLFRDFISKYF